MVRYDFSEFLLKLKLLNLFIFLSGMIETRVLICLLHEIFVGCCQPRMGFFSGDQFEYQPDFGQKLKPAQLSYLESMLFKKKCNL